MDNKLLLISWFHNGFILVYCVVFIQQFFHERKFNHNFVKYYIYIVNKSLNFYTNWWKHNLCNSIAFIIL